MSPTRQHIALSILRRGVVGFVAGFLLAEFTLVFLGLSLSQGHWNLSAPELEQEYRALRLALCIGAGVAVLAVLAGRVHVPRFLLTFVVVFAVIWIIPYWSHPMTGQRTPFGTPYLNGGFHRRDAVQLTWHVALSVVIAAPVHGLAVWMTRIGKREVPDISPSDRT